MIVGIGSDVVEIHRIAQACDRYGDAFLQRILSQTEVNAAVTMQIARRHEYVAGRFAAKEAMAKASGKGLARLKMPFVTIETTDDGLRVQFASKSHLLAQEGFSWHVSISHSASVAFAVAVLEKR